MVDKLFISWITLSVICLVIAILGVFDVVPTSFIPYWWAIWGTIQVIFLGALLIAIVSDTDVD